MYKFTREQELKNPTTKPLVEPVVSDCDNDGLGGKDCGFGKGQGERIEAKVQGHGVKNLNSSNNSKH